MAPCALDDLPVVTDLVTVHPLVVVGAGRAALALVSRLPADLLSVTTVLDAHGEWLHAWAQRLKRCGAQHVRVPCTGAPLPDPLGLKAFAQATGRTGELLFSSPRVVAVPTVQLYADYVAHACSRPDAAASLVTLRKATSMLDVDERARLRLPAGGVRVHLADGSSLCAARVVLATSSKVPAPVPACLLNAGGPLARGLDGPKAVDVDAQPVSGAHVCVIGGGTAAATLALAALSRGASQVTLVARSYLRKREHDVDASWMGAAALREFWQRTEPMERLKAVRSARGGGSINARHWTALRAALKAGTLRIEEQAAVTSACYDAAVSQWTLHLRCGDPASDAVPSQLSITADVLWCACGSAPDAGHDPVVAQLLSGECVRTRVVGGLPVLTDLSGGLRFPGTPVYVVGHYAALSVGPAAGLHAGQRIAAEAVVAALARHGAAVASGDLPFDVPAGALDLDNLEDDPQSAAARDPFYVPPSAATQQQRKKCAPQEGVAAVDVADLPPGLPRHNIASYTWTEAAACGDAADMRLTVSAPLTGHITGETIRSAFTARGADVWVICSDVAYRLHLPALFREVLPKRCGAHVARAGDGAARLFVTMYKRESAPWRMLKAL